MSNDSRAQVKYLHCIPKSIFKHRDTVETYRIKIRSLLLIHSLFKGIFRFELELRFASTLMIQEASVGPQILYRPGFPKHKTGERRQGETRVSSKFTDIRNSLQTADMAKCDRPQRDDMNSNKAFTRQKTKTLQKAFWKSPRSCFLSMSPPPPHN